MPGILNLKLTARDFRQHPAMDNRAPHWLIGTVYGRQLLKAKLRQMRPDLRVSFVNHQPEYEPLLECAVDVLDLRDWAEPNTLSEGLRALCKVLRMTLQLAEAPVDAARVSG
jgi:hypothetical protein